MSLVFDDSLLDFDLSAFQPSSNNAVVCSNRAYRAIRKTKRKIMSADVIINNYKRLSVSYKELEKSFVSSKEELKQACLDTMEYREKCLALDKVIKDLQLNIKDLELNCVTAQNKHDGMQSHAKQLEQLVKEMETTIESLKIENLSGKSINAKIQKEKEQLPKNMCYMKNLAIGKKKLPKEQKSFILKHVKKSADDALNSEEIKCDNVNTFDEVLSPDFEIHNNQLDLALPIKNLRENQNASGSELRSFDITEGSPYSRVDHDHDEDDGRGSSIAFSDSDKCFNSPEYFIDSPFSGDFLRNKNKLTVNVSTSPLPMNDVKHVATSPIIFENFDILDGIEKKVFNEIKLSDCDNNRTGNMTDRVLSPTFPTHYVDVSTSPVKNSTNDAGTSPLKQDETSNCNNQQDDKNTHEKYLMDINNSCCLEDENSNDCEVQMIFNSMRFRQKIITPLPTTPAKSRNLEALTDNAVQTMLADFFNQAEEKEERKHNYLINVLERIEKNVEMLVSNKSTEKTPYIISGDRTVALVEREIEDRVLVQNIAPMEISKAINNNAINLRNEDRSMKLKKLNSILFADSSPPSPSDAALHSPPSPSDAALRSPPRRSDVALLSPPSPSDAALRSPPRRSDVALLSPPSPSDAALRSPPRRSDVALLSPPSPSDAALPSPPRRSDVALLSPPSPSDAALPSPPRCSDAALVSPPSPSDAALLSPPSPSEAALPSPPRRSDAALPSPLRPSDATLFSSPFPSDAALPSPLRPSDATLFSSPSPSDAALPSPLRPSETVLLSLPSPSDATLPSPPRRSDGALFSSPSPSDAMLLSPPSPSEAALPSPPRRSDAALVSPPSPSDAALLSPPSPSEAALPSPPRRSDAALPSPLRPSDSTLFSSPSPSDAALPSPLRPSETVLLSLPSPSDAALPSPLRPNDATLFSPPGPSDAALPPPPKPSDAALHSLLRPSDTALFSSPSPSDAALPSPLRPSDAALFSPPRIEKNVEMLVSNKSTEKTPYIISGDRTVALVEREIEDRVLVQNIAPMEISKAIDNNAINLRNEDRSMKLKKLNSILFADSSPPSPSDAALHSPRRPSDTALFSSPSTSDASMPSPLRPSDTALVSPSSPSDDAPPSPPPYSLTLGENNVDNSNTYHEEDICLKENETLQFEVPVSSRGSVKDRALSDSEVYESEIVIELPPDTLESDTNSLHDMLKKQDSKQQKIHEEVQNKKSPKKKNITKLEKLRQRMLPKSKIKYVDEQVKRRKRIQLNRVNTNGDKMSVSQISHNAAYEKACKVMSELRSKEKVKKKDEYVTVLPPKLSLSPKKGTLKTFKCSELSMSDIFNSNKTLQKSCIQTQNQGIGKDDLSKFTLAKFPVKFNKPSKPIYEISNTSQSKETVKKNKTPTLENSQDFQNNCGLAGQRIIRTRSQSKSMSHDVSMTQKPEIRSDPGLPLLSPKMYGKNRRKSQVEENLIHNNTIFGGLIKSNVLLHVTEESNDNSDAKRMASRTTLKRKSVEVTDFASKRKLRSSSFRNDSTELQSKGIIEKNEEMISRTLKEMVTYGDIDIFEEAEKHTNQLVVPRAKKYGVLGHILDRYCRKSKITASKLPENAINFAYKTIEDGIAETRKLPLKKDQKVAMDEMVKNLLGLKQKQILAGIIKFLKQPERKIELQYKKYEPMAPPLTEAESILIYFFMKLKVMWPDIVENMMTRMEHCLFMLNRSPDCGVIETVAHFYAVLCRYDDNRPRLRMFIMDAMYCMQFKAVPLIKQCMEVEMKIFPLAHMAKAKESLVTCLVYLLHFFKCDDRKNILQDIRNLFHRKYFYDMSEWNEPRILEMFRNSIMELSDLSPERRMLHIAFILLAKRNGALWCQTNIIQNMLLPIIEQPHVPDRVKQFCVCLLGRLLKPYPMDMRVNCEIVMNQLFAMLSRNPSDKMVEAIYSSLIHMSKHNPNRVIKALFFWKPARISPELAQLLKNFVKERPLKSWRTVISKFPVQQT